MTGIDHDDRARIARLGVDDLDLARRTFTTMAAVFGEPDAPLGDDDLEVRLGSPAFWALTATVDGEPVGGLAAHTLPLTNRAASEVFVYDVAVRPDWQRRGIARGLVDALRSAAAATGIDTVFVAADRDDGHALEFYRAIGGIGADVVMFEWRV